MAKKGKLLAALDAHKGRDYKLEKQKKLQKQAERRKRLKTVEQVSGSDNADENGAKVTGEGPRLEDESDGWESDESEAAAPMAIDTSRIDDSDTDSDDSIEQDEEAAPKDAIDATNADPIVEAEVGKDNDSDEDEDEDEDVDEDEDQDDVPFSDIESLASEEKGDLVPHQRLTINNTTALLAAHKSIAASISLPFSAHQTLLSASPVVIADVNDDLTRELAFYKQCLDSANEARTLLKKEGVPFSRPNDYFAEMVKSDEHMGKIKQKMAEEAANKKAAAEARKQRDLKKFGKQVQVAKLQERDRQKRDTLGKIDLLKRKRKNTDVTAANEEDLFDVALEDARKADKADRPARNPSRGGDRGRGPPNKRQKKDEKFGFGGKKRFAKSGDAVSTGDLRGFSAKKMKGQKKGPQRLGKSRRAKA